MARLQSARGSYLWLALDHGLTFGNIRGLGGLADLLAAADEVGVSGIVANRGGAAAMPPASSAGLVLQTFGRPSLTGDSGAKVPTCRIDDAVRLAADAISIQLDLGGPGLSQAIHAISLMISDAATCDIPTVAMVKIAKGNDPLRATADALRISTELGVDLIKIGLPVEMDTANSDQIVALRQAVALSAPALLAGGERREDFTERMAAARDLGFSGACIGRSVFQDPDPESVLAAMSAVF
ncbi:MAG TPA: hypothetical protein VF081_12170 [Solirubrobacterales bacterium]